MSSPTATRETVKAASIFLVCLSTPYMEAKQSNQEFSWCLETRRPFLIMLLGDWTIFPPKGAMGMAMAGRLYVDFSKGINAVNVPQIQQLSGKLGVGEEYSMATAKLPSKVVQAIKKGDLPALQAMYSAGVELSADGDAEWRWSPLCWAVYEKKPEIVKWLVEEALADPNVIEKAGKLPLHVACKNGALDEIKYLVQRGTDINFIANTPKDSWSPLMYVSKHNHIECAQYLLAHGADPLQADQLGNTAIKLATNDAMRKVLNGPRPPSKHWDVFWSYNWGVQKEAISMVARLKADGISVWQDIEQMSGGDELFTSIDTGMRQSSVVVMSVTEAYAKSPNCIKEAYLCAGLNKPRVPVLSQAKMQYPPEGPMNKLLAPLQALDLVTDPDKGYQQLLLELRRQLHAVKSQAGEEGKDGKVSLEQGKVAGRNYGVYSKELEVACTKGDLAAVKKLVGVDMVDPDAQDPKWGWSSIAWAVYEKRNNVVEWLCNEGRANPNVVDVNGKTALHTACKYDNKDACTFLLKRGGLVNHLVTLKATTWTPLMYAAAEGHGPLCQYLIQWGADPRLEDKDGKTAISHCKKADVKAILEKASSELEAVKAPVSPDLVIAYDEINAAHAMLIGSNLERAGVRVWLVDFKKSGMDLFIDVDRSMRSSAVVVCLLGEDLDGSPELQQMINLCDGLKKPLVSARIQAAAQFPPPGPMGPILAPNPVCDVLSGAQFEESIQQLLRFAQAYLDASKRSNI
eukprot:gb/GEZN01002273.1/.p1 GENE.gb/GEZN01002273.1/~~gb/GEZN01002273.1/.p1  ORF type:complete len:795 (+),score=134.43 gb/GEZN01002273.1/:159-2387(+)